MIQIWGHSLFLVTLFSFYAAAATPDLGTASLNETLSWARARNQSALKDYATQNRGRHPSPSHWRNEVVYQIVVDRFNDGNPSNNHLNIEDEQRNYENNTQLGLQDYRHGGDLKGITQRMDYLAELGVSTLWITPILKTQGSYHGYCTQDPTEIDPGFGTAQDLRDLTREAHKRGIKVVLDIVVNHLCDKGSQYDDVRTPFNSAYYGLCLQDQDSKTWSGQPQSPRGQRDLLFGNNFFGPFRSPHFFNRCGFKPGDFASSGPAAVFGDFSPQMFDLNTLNWDFQEIFTELHKYWVAYADIDGFRLDAAKHVTADFVSYFSVQMRDFAKRIGKDNFFVVGEVADSPATMAYYLGRMKANVDNPAQSNGIAASTRERLKGLRDVYTQHPRFALPGLNAVYDFAHSGAMRDVFQNGGSPRRIKNWFWSGGETENSQCSPEFCELAFNGDSRENWNLLEIHDWPRFLMHLPRAGLVYPSLGYLLTTQGVPILYYGIEQGLNGHCDFRNSSVLDPEARRRLEGVCRSDDFHNHTRYRQDMFVSGPWKLGSHVGEIDKLKFIGKTAAKAPTSWQQDPYLKTQHELFQFVRRMNKIRRQCFALADGGIYFRAAHEVPGLLAFSRIAGHQEILVLVNTSTNSISIRQMLLDANVNGSSLGHVYRNLLNAGETGRVAATPGNGRELRFEPNFQLKPDSVAVFSSNCTVD